MLLGTVGLAAISRSHDFVQLSNGSFPNIRVEVF